MLTFFLEYLIVHPLDKIKTWSFRTVGLWDNSKWLRPSPHQIRSWKVNYYTATPSYIQDTRLHHKDVNPPTFEPWYYSRQYSVEKGFSPHCASKHCRGVCCVRFPGECTLTPTFTICARHWHIGQWPLRTLNDCDHTYITAPVVLNLQI